MKPYRNPYSDPNSPQSRFNDWVQRTNRDTTERLRRESQRSAEAYKQWAKRQAAKENKDGNRYQKTTTPSLTKKSWGSIKPTRLSYPSATQRPIRRIGILLTILLLSVLGFALVVFVPILSGNGKSPVVTNPAVQQPAGDRGTTNTTPASVVKHVNTDWLNVRESAGVDDTRPALGQLKRGAAVTLLGQSQVVGERTWVLIKADTVTGWVRQDYLK